METIGIEGPQGALRVQVTGDRGTPVILVHGNGGRGSQWEQELARLGGRHRAAALDLRGMGGSAPPRNGDFSVGALADDVMAAADALGFGSFVLVGHSLGGYVIACCAGRWSERLLGLVFVDHGGDPRADSQEKVELLTRGLAPECFAAFSRQAMETCLKGAGAEVKALVLAHLKATLRAHFAAAVLGLLDFDAGFALRSYAGPMLHIHSPFLEAQDLAPIHRQVPGMAAVRLEDCSHWVHLDQPDAFHELLERFLASTASH